MAWQSALNRASIIAILGIVFAVIALALVYAQFAQPILDDWCFSLIMTTPLEAANGLYQSWSGRWPAMFLYASVMRQQLVTSANYPLLVIWSFPVWLAGFYIVAHAAMRGERLRAKVVAALAMLAVFWSSAPGSAEIFYWVAGNILYAVPFALSTASIAMICSSRESAAYLGGASAMAFLAAAMNEVSGIILAVAGVGLVADAYLGKRSFKTPLLVLAAVLVGLAIIVLSPGNAARQSIQSTMSLPKIVWTVIRPYESVLSIVADPRVLALTVLALVLPKRRSPVKRWWLIPITAVVALGISVLAVAFATGNAPGYRVLAYLFAVMLGAWFGTAWVMPPLKVELPVRAAIQFAFAALLLTAPVVGVALHDLPKAESVWNAEHRAMWRMLTAQKGRDAVVRDYPFYLSIYPDREIATNADNQPNRCIAKAFGLSSLRSVGPNGYRWRH